MGEPLVPPGEWFELEPLAPSPDGGGGGPCARLIWAIAIKLRRNMVNKSDLNVFFMVLVLIIVFVIRFCCCQYFPFVSGIIFDRVWNPAKVVPEVVPEVYPPYLALNKHLTCVSIIRRYYPDQIVTGIGIQTELHKVVGTKFFMHNGLSYCIIHIHFALYYTSWFT